MVDATNDLLKQKQKLEFEWQNKYKQNGVYTNAMINIDKAIDNVKKQIIVSDIAKKKNS